MQIYQFKPLTPVDEEMTQDYPWNCIALHREEITSFYYDETIYVGITPSLIEYLNSMDSNVNVPILTTDVDRKWHEIIHENCIALHREETISFYHDETIH